MKKEKTRTLNLDEEILLKEMKKEVSPSGKNEKDKAKKEDFSKIADFFTFIVAEKTSRIRDVLEPIEDDAVILYSSKLEKIEKFVSGTENALLLINIDEIELGVETISHLLRLSFHSLVLISQKSPEAIASFVPRHPKIKIFNLSFQLKQIEELIED